MGEYRQGRILAHFHKLIDDNQGFAFEYAVAFADIDGDYRAFGVGLDVVLHLHGFEEHDGLTDLDLVTHIDKDVEDGAGERRGDLGTTSSTAGLGSRGTLHIAVGCRNTGSGTVADDSGVGSMLMHFLVNGDIVRGAIDFEFYFLAFYFIDFNVVVVAVYFEFVIFHLLVIM